MNLHQVSFSFAFALAAHFSYAQSAPIVAVSAPATGDTVTSPVNIIAAASPQSCSKGINAMRVYPSSGDGAYTVLSDQVNVDLNLTAGSYRAVVVAWDNCGNVGTGNVNFTVSSATLPPPKFVYATQYQAGKIAGYLVNPESGALTPNGQPPAWAHWGPESIASDSGGYRLYVANFGSKDVSAYFINRSNGHLSPVPGANFAAAGTPSQIAVHPSNHFVYVTTPDTNTITAFSVASSGSLVPVAGSPFATASSCYRLAFTPNGNYLYAQCNAGIDAYAINKNSGALTPVSGSPFTVPPAQCEFCISEIDLDAIAVDRTGNFLFAADNSNGVVYSERIDQSTGALTEVPGSPFIDDEPKCPRSGYCVGGAPISLAVDARNKFVYVLNQADNDIAAFALDSSTGTLTRDSLSFPGSNSNYSLGFGSVATDPSGSFVFALGGYSAKQGASQTGVIYGFAVGQADGSLAPTPNSPYQIEPQRAITEGFAVTR